MSRTFFQVFITIIILGILMAYKLRVSRLEFLTKKEFECIVMGSCRENFEANEHLINQLEDDIQFIEQTELNNSTSKLIINDIYSYFLSVGHFVSINKSGTKFRVQNDTVYIHDNKRWKNIDDSEVVFYYSEADGKFFLKSISRASDIINEDYCNFLRLN